MSGPHHRATIDEIRADLDRIAERLADLSIDLLAQAVDTAEEPERVALANQERRLAKVRRAVDKARSDLPDQTYPTDPTDR